MWSWASDNTCFITAWHVSCGSQIPPLRYVHCWWLSVAMSMPCVTGSILYRLHDVTGPFVCIFFSFICARRVIVRSSALSFVLFHFTSSFSSFFMCSLCRRLSLLHVQLTMRVGNGCLRRTCSQPVLPVAVDCAVIEFHHDHKNRAAQFHKVWGCLRRPALCTGV